MFSIDSLLSPGDHLLKILSVAMIILGTAQNQSVCGNGVSCDNLCGNDAVGAFIVFDNSKQSQWCTEVDNVMGDSVTKSRSSPCVCNVPVYFLSWCPRKVKYAGKLFNYRACCLHPYIKLKVEGASSTCRRMGIYF